MGNPSKTYRTFALFDLPKIGNLMIPYLIHSSSTGTTTPFVTFHKILVRSRFDPYVIGLVFHPLNFYTYPPQTSQKHVDFHTFKAKTYPTFSFKLLPLATLTTNRKLGLPWHLPSIHWSTHWSCCDCNGHRYCQPSKHRLEDLLGALQIHQQIEWDLTNNLTNGPYQVSS